ncbi:hypothetical protein EVAR_74835_1 [Eumeta japonica]|uniref:Mariner Mos1 transposase n=1 Tax=Eumeta variegata TaxID=151549 RepID=A0A4C1SRY3_EUMVA|nr:hypothetical protein EVAR_74835_1 [Eumeta japonica]
MDYPPPPHILTKARKLRHVIWCRETLKIFVGGDSNAVQDIVTGDESWIYCYDPETKRQSARWTASRRINLARESWSGALADAVGSAGWRGQRPKLFRLEGADRRPRGDVSKCVNAESRRLFCI